MTSAEPAFTTMPLPAASTPPSVYGHEIVSALLIVTAPKPAGSRQLISPPAAVLLIAPANVLHGAVRLHGLTSSPTPETHVRLAWANALWPRAVARITNTNNHIFRIDSP